MRSFGVPPGVLAGQVVGHEVRPVEPSVEDAELLVGAALDPYLGEDLLPRGLGFSPDGVEVEAQHIALEVFACPLDADERNPDPGLHHLVLGGIEGSVSAYLLILLARRRELFPYFVIDPRPGLLERPIELRGEV